MTTCVTCGFLSVSEEGFCQVCDFGWDPETLEADQQAFGRKAGMPPSVPYKIDGSVDWDAARGQMSAREYAEIQDLERQHRLKAKKR